MKYDIEKDNVEYFKTCHSALLVLLKFLHELCVKNNIKYTLESGTLLGAIRDKGFIPWDDDADVTLIREEYDKLIEVLKNTDFPEGISVDFPDTRKDFFDFNVRLFKNDVIIRNDEASVNQFDGVFMHPALDIFAMDHYPKSKIKRRIFVLKQQLIFGLAMSKRNDIKIKKYKFVERVAISILSKIGKLFTIKSLCDIHDKISKDYLNKNVDYLYCTGWSPEYPGWVFDRKTYESVSLNDFEDTKLFAVDDYEAILDGYGDWRTPDRTHDHMKFVENL